MESERYRALRLSLAERFEDISVQTKTFAIGVKQLRTLEGIVARESAKILIENQGSLQREFKLLFEELDEFLPMVEERRHQSS